MGSISREEMHMSCRRWFAAAASLFAVLFTSLALAQAPVEVPLTAPAPVLGL